MTNKNINICFVFFLRFPKILEHVKMFYSGNLFVKFQKNCATQMGNALRKTWWNLCESESNYGPRRSLKAVNKESSKFSLVKIIKTISRSRTSIVKAFFIKWNEILF